jgi:hypothetical protein
VAVAATLGVAGLAATGGGIDVQTLASPIGSPEFLQQIRSTAQQAAKTTSNVVLPYLEEQIQAAEQKFKQNNAGVATTEEQIAQDKLQAKLLQQMTETPAVTVDTPQTQQEANVDAKADEIVQQALQAARMELQRNDQEQPTSPQSTTSESKATASATTHDDEESTTDSSAFDRWQQSQKLMAATTTDAAASTDFLQTQAQQTEQAKAALENAEAATITGTNAKSTVSFTKPEPDIEVVTDKKIDDTSLAFSTAAKDNAITVEVQRVEDEKETTPLTTTSSTPPTPKAPVTAAATPSAAVPQNQDKAPTFLEYTANMAKEKLPQVIATAKSVSQTVSEKVQKKVLPQMLDYGGKAVDAFQQNVPVFVEQSKRAAKSVGEASQQSGMILGEVGPQAFKAGQQAVKTGAKVAHVVGDTVVPKVVETATDIWQDEEKRKIAGAGIASAGAAVATSVAVNKFRGRSVEEGLSGNQEKDEMTQNHPSNGPFGGMNGLGNAAGISNNTMGYPTVTNRVPKPPTTTSTSFYSTKQSTTPFTDKVKSSLPLGPKASSQFGNRPFNSFDSRTSRPPPPPFGASPMDPSTAFGDPSISQATETMPPSSSRTPPSTSQSRSSLYPNTDAPAVQKAAASTGKTGASPFPWPTSNNGSSPNGVKTSSSPFGANPGSNSFGAKTGTNPFAKNAASPFRNASNDKSSATPKSISVPPPTTESPFRNSATNAFAKKIESPMEARHIVTSDTFDSSRTTSKEAVPYGLTSVESSGQSSGPVHPFSSNAANPLSKIHPNPIGSIASTLFAKKTDPTPIATASTRLNITETASNAVSSNSGASPFVSKLANATAFEPVKSVVPPFGPKAPKSDVSSPTKVSSATSFYTTPRQSAPFNSSTFGSAFKAEAIAGVNTGVSSPSFGANKFVKPKPVSEVDPRNGARPPFFSDTSRSGYGLLSNKAGAPQDEEDMLSFYQAIRDKAKTDAIKDVLNGSVGKANGVSDEALSSRPAKSTSDRSSFFSGTDSNSSKSTVTSYWSALQSQTEGKSNDNPEADGEQAPLSASSSSKTTTRIHPYGSTCSDIPSILQDAENGQGASTFFRNGNAPTATATSSPQSSFAPKTPKATNGTTAPKQKKPVIRPNEGYGVLSSFTGSFPTKSDTSTDQQGGWSAGNTKSQQELTMDAVSGDKDTPSTFL